MIIAHIYHLAPMLLLKTHGVCIRWYHRIRFSGEKEEIGAMAVG